jgi:hypothetical protein
MKKSLFIAIPIAAIAAGFVFQEPIREAYLQHQVHQSLTIDNGTMLFCGVPSNANEEAASLIERVKAQTHATDTLRAITDKVDGLVLEETLETEEILEQLAQWGWEDDVYIDEKIEQYKKYKDGYFKEQRDKYIAKKAYRANAPMDDKELRAELKEIRAEKYLNNKDEIDSFITNAVTELACKADDASILNELPSFISTFDYSRSDEDKKTLEDQFKVRANENRAIAKEPMEKFTMRFFQFINDTVANLKVIDQETTIEEDDKYNTIDIDTTITAVSTNVFGKKNNL